MSRSLPQLPENQFWRVEKEDTVFSVVLLVERRTKKTFTGKIKHYEKVLDKAFTVGVLTEEDIEYGAQRIIERRDAERLYGDYPPKTLGEK